MKLLDLHLVLACCLALAHSSSSGLDAPQKPPMGAAAEQSDADRKAAANASKASHSLQSDEPQGPSVELNYGISADRHGILSCEVSLDAAAQQRLRTAPNSVSSVYLICPQVPTSICYFDCTPSCTFEGESSATVCKVPEMLAAVVMSCDYRILNSATILVKYTVNMEALDSTGNWSCEYQGVRARPLLLQAAEQQTTTQLLPPPRGLSSTGSTTAEPVVVEASMPKKLPDKKEDAVAASKGPLEENGNKELYILTILSQTRPEVILALIIVIMLTLLVNSALFLRCCLTSSYFDSLRRGKPDHRLGRLLCLESRSDKPYHRPEVTVHPLPVQAGPYYYHPQPQAGSVSFLPHSDCSLKFPEPYTTPAYAHVRPYLGHGGTCGSGSDVHSLAGSQSDQGLSVRLPPGGGGRKPSNATPVAAATTLSHETLSLTSSIKGSREYFLPVSDPAVTGHILPPVYSLKTCEGAATATKEAPHLEAGRRRSTTSSSKDHLRGLNHHNPPSTVSTTIYDDLSAISYHAVTPMLVRLPAGETGIILCHRPDSLPAAAAGAAAMPAHPTVVANDYTFTGCAVTQVPPPQSPSMDENCTVSTQSTESGEYGKVLRAFPNRRGGRRYPPSTPPPPPPRGEEHCSAQKQEEEERQEEEGTAEKKRLFIYADTVMPVRKTTESSEPLSTKEPYVFLSGTNP